MWLRWHLLGFVVLSFVLSCVLSSKGGRREWEEGWMGKLQHPLRLHSPFLPPRLAGCVSGPRPLLAFIVFSSSLSLPPWAPSLGRSSLFLCTSFSCERFSFHCHFFSSIRWLYFLYFFYVLPAAALFFRSLVGILFIYLYLFICLFTLLSDNKDYEKKTDKNKKRTLNCRAHNADKIT